MEEMAHLALECCFSCSVTPFIDLLRNARSLATFHPKTGPSKTTRNAQLFLHESFYFW